VIRKVIELDQVREIDNRLDMAEAMNLAFVAAMSKKDSDPARAYKRYRRELVSRKNKLLGIKVPTIWDQMPKGKSRRI